MARWFTLIFFHFRKPRFTYRWPGDLPWSFTWESEDLLAAGQMIYLDLPLSLEKDKICLQMARWFTLIFHFHLRKPRFACRYHLPLSLEKAKICLQMARPRWFTLIFHFHLRKPRFACRWLGDLPWSSTFAWESQDLLVDGQVISLDLSLEKAMIYL